MMQDVFIEYMVKRQRTPKTFFTKVGVGFLGVVVCLAAFMLSPFLGPFSFIGVLVAFGSIYGAYILITSLNVEFEYSLTNGDMDIDKIVAQRKRKRLITLKMREVEDFGRYNAKEHENKSYQTKIMAFDHPMADDLYFATVRHKEKGLTLVVFNANDRMIEGIKPYLPRPIFHRVFQART